MFLPPISNSPPLSVRVADPAPVAAPLMMWPETVTLPPLIFRLPLAVMPEAMELFPRRTEAESTVLFAMLTRPFVIFTTPLRISVPVTAVSARPISRPPVPMVVTPPLIWRTDVQVLFVTDVLAVPPLSPTKIVVTSSVPRAKVSVSSRSEFRFCPPTVKVLSESEASTLLKSTTLPPEATAAVTAEPVARLNAARPVPDLSVIERVPPPPPKKPASRVPVATLTVSALMMVETLPR